jgi:hypothetical protein
MKIPFESSFLGRPCTVKGELRVASFLVNYFSRVHFQTLVAVTPARLYCKSTANGHHRAEPILALYVEQDYGVQ